MKFLVALTLVVATSMTTFSQTNPKDAKSPTKDTSLLEFLETIQDDPTTQRELSNLGKGFFDQLGLAPEAVLNRPLPSFSLKTLKNKKLTSEDLLGKITFICIWDPNCEDCLQEFTDMNALQQSFQNQDVVFLSLPMADTTSVKEYLKKHPLNFQHIPAAFSLIQELSYTTQNVLVDKDGIIRYLTHDPFADLMQAKPTNWQLVQDQINDLLIE